MDTAAPPKDGEHPPFTIALKRLFQHVYIPEALPENTNIKMTIVHIVLFKFRPDVADDVRQEFLSQIKTLKSLPCVKQQRLVVGGPSITEPMEKSKGFQYALVSYHEDRAALAAYQASSEHERVTSTYFIPYKDDLVRFDFEVDHEDEPLLGFGNAL